MLEITGKFFTWIQDVLKTRAWFRIKCCFRIQKNNIIKGDIPCIPDRNTVFDGIPWNKRLGIGDDLIQEQRRILDKSDCFLCLNFIDLISVCPRDVYIAAIIDVRLCHRMESRTGDNCRGSSASGIERVC